MRSLRENIALLDSDKFTVFTLASSLKQEAATLLGESAGEMLLKIDQVLTEGINELDLEVDDMKDNLKKHDLAVADVWASLSSVMKSVKDISTFGEKLERVEAALDNKVSSSELQDIAREMTSSANADILTSVDNQMKLFGEALEQQRGRIDGISEKQSQQPTLSIVPSHVPPSDSAQVKVVSEIISDNNKKWNPTEMEPLIKDIVDMYLADWRREEEEEEEEEGLLAAAGAWR